MSIGTQPPTDRERIVAIEAVLPHLASKADVAAVQVNVAEVKADLERMQANMIKWQIGIGIAIVSAVFAIVRFLG